MLLKSKVQNQTIFTLKFYLEGPNRSVQTGEMHKHNRETSNVELSNLPNTNKTMYLSNLLPTPHITQQHPR